MSWRRKHSVQELTKLSIIWWANLTLLYSTIVKMNLQTHSSKKDTNITYKNSNNSCSNCKDYKQNWLHEYQFSRASAPIMETCAELTWQLSLRQFVLLCICPRVWEYIGETSHSLLTWSTTNLSPDSRQPFQTCSVGHHKHEYQFSWIRGPRTQKRRKRSLAKPNKQLKEQNHWKQILIQQQIWSETGQ